MDNVDAIQEVFFVLLPACLSVSQLCGERIVTAVVVFMQIRQCSTILVLTLA